jgi:hypothetical protein
VAGAAVGGATVTLLGVRPSLLIDAVTFLASGLLIGLGTQARPAAVGLGAGQGSPLARAAAGLRLVFGDRALRTLVLLGWLVVFYTIPQGIAAPYAARLGGGPIATGLVLASTAAATAVATPLFSRFVSPGRRAALMGPLAVATCATLLLTALRPGLVISLVIFSAAAASGAYQLAVNTAFVIRVPDERRAQAFGIASMGVVVAQGAAFVAAGAAAEVVTPASVIAAGGGIGAVVGLALTVSWRRATSPKRSPYVPEQGPPPADEAIVTSRAPVGAAGWRYRRIVPGQKVRSANGFYRAGGGGRRSRRAAGDRAVRRGDVRRLRDRLPARPRHDRGSNRARRGNPGRR